MPDKAANGDEEKLPGSLKKAVTTVEVAVGGCAIQSVVVYRDRAEVKRIVPASLATGENEVIVTGLAECVDKNSVRVEGQGAAVITDVIYSSETEPKAGKGGASSGSKVEYEGLQAEIQEREGELKRLRFKDEVLGRQRTLLVQFASHISKGRSETSQIESISLKTERDASHFKKKGGEYGLRKESRHSSFPPPSPPAPDIDVAKSEGGNLGDFSLMVEEGTVANVLAFFERYEERVASLDKRTMEVQQDIKKLEEKIRVLQANAEKFNPEAKVVSKETIRSLRVALEAREATDVTLVVSYVVSNASWASAYDVRVFSKNKTMKVQYYGLIKQSTGEDWENANISLSTAQPSIGGSAPSLSTRLIRFKRPQINLSELEWLAHGQERFRTITSVAERLLNQALEFDVAKVNSGLFNTTYAIPRTTSIPADSTEHKVTVALVDLEPEFHSSSVPRLSPHSFLQATARNTSPYTMLAGPANIFLNNNFVAKSELSDVSPNEEFTTSLGVDQSVRITARPVDVVHGNTGVLTKNKLVTYTHTFVVKNTTTDTVSVQVSERVPLSTDDRIKVHILEPELKKQNARCPLPFGYALLNESNNLEWHASLASETEVELRLVYSVEYPLQDDVQGLPKS